MMLYFLAIAAAMLPLGGAIGWNASRYRQDGGDRELVVPAVAVVFCGLVLFAFHGTWREGAYVRGLIGYLVVALMNGAAIFIVCDWIANRRATQTRLLSAGVLSALLLSPLTGIMSFATTCWVIGDCL